jgi:hypothetical protein
MLGLRDSSEGCREGRVLIDMHKSSLRSSKFQVALFQKELITEPDSRAVGANRDFVGTPTKFWCCGGGH